MKSNRLGCLSASGIFATLITLILISGTGIARGGSLFSPGQLNAEAGEKSIGGVRSHADITQCAACHAPIWSGQQMGDRCLVCHTELTHNPTEFHNIMLAEGKKTPCYHCHTEHDGPQAPLTFFYLENFPHQEVGYSLRAHQKMDDGTTFACSDCHEEAITTFNQIVCEDCHNELEPEFLAVHTHVFGQECLACHDGLDTYGEGFDHNLSKFPLQGKHAPLECGDCHSEARSLADLQMVPVDCAACHAEPAFHKSLFNGDCAVCHGTAYWRPAEYAQAHTFPVDHGEHGRNVCQVCHEDNLQTYKCYGCHEHTPSNVESKHREEGISDFKNCVKCHATGHEGEGGEEGDD
ncbi:MAG TPA: cytochrome c3 family protein [Anaerolineales bacterium]